MMTSKIIHNDATIDEYRWLTNIVSNQINVCVEEFEDLLKPFSKLNRVEDLTSSALKYYLEFAKASELKNFEELFIDTKDNKCKPSYYRRDCYLLGDSIFCMKLPFAVLINHLDDKYHIHYYGADLELLEKMLKENILWLEVYHYDQYLNMSNFTKKLLKLMINLNYIPQYVDALEHALMCYWIRNIGKNTRLELNTQVENWLYNDYYEQIINKNYNIGYDREKVEIRSKLLELINEKLDDKECELHSGLKCRIRKFVLERILKIMLLEDIIYHMNGIELLSTQYLYNLYNLIREMLKNKNWDEIVKAIFVLWQNIGTPIFYSEGAYVDFSVRDFIFSQPQNNVFEKSDIQFTDQFTEVEGIFLPKSLFNLLTKINIDLPYSNEGYKQIEKTLKHRKKIFDIYIKGFKESYTDIETIYDFYRKVTSFNEFNEIVKEVIINHIAKNRVEKVGKYINIFLFIKTILSLIMLQNQNIPSFIDTCFWLAQIKSAISESVSKQCIAKWLYFTTIGKGEKEGKHVIVNSSCSYDVEGLMKLKINRVVFNLPYQQRDSLRLNPKGYQCYNQ